MPEGLPTAASLIDQKVTFFSIDTDVLQSHGFKFNEGTLHALATQRPHWFHIQLTDVVEREVLAHRMEPVAKAVQEMQSAITKVQRLAEQDLKEVKDAFDALLLALSIAVLPLTAWADNCGCGPTYCTGTGKYSALLAKRKHTQPRKACPSGWSPSTTRSPPVNTAFPRPQTGSASWSWMPQAPSLSLRGPQKTKPTMHGTWPQEN